MIVLNVFPHKALLSLFCEYNEYFWSLASDGMNTCDLPGEDKYLAILPFDFLSIGGDELE